MERWQNTKFSPWPRGVPVGGGVWSGIDNNLNDNIPHPSPRKRGTPISQGENFFARPPRYRTKARFCPSLEVRS